MHVQEKAQYLAEVMGQIIAPEPMVHLFGRAGVGKTEVVRAAVQMLGNAAYLATPPFTLRPEDFPRDLMLQALAENDILVLDEPGFYLNTADSLEELRRSAVEQGKLLLLITQQEKDRVALGLSVAPRSLVMVELKSQEMRISMGSEWPKSYLRLPFTGGSPRLVTSDADLAERAARIVSESGDTLGVEAD